MNPDLTLLDNPAWWALCGPQNDLASGNGQLKAYQNHILPFAAWNAPKSTSIHTAASRTAPPSTAIPTTWIETSGYSPIDLRPLEQWLPAGKPFFMIGALPALPSNWQIEKELPCLQMLWSLTEGTTGTQLDPAPAAPRLDPAPAAPQLDPDQLAPHISPLEPKDKMTMYDLVQKVQPGYYEPDSYRLGKYFGIFEGNRLIAMAGERMRLDGMSEISAVCTDPDFRNRGYGARLTLEVCRYNAKEGRLPFLHVLERNESAIRLYENLGFKTRRIISFWKLSYC